MPADNTAGLRRAAQRRWERTRAKAIDALRQLDQAGDPITFEAVARTAGISRSWLYEQSELREEIQRLREATKRPTGPSIPARQRASDASLLARLQVALERNRMLAEENQRLRRQLARALGDERALARGGHNRASTTSNVAIP